MTGVVLAAALLSLAFLCREREREVVEAAPTAPGLANTVNITVLVGNYVALHTKFLQGTLVPLAANDAFVIGLGFGMPSLKSDNPPVALGRVRGLESVLVHMILEGEVSGPCFGHILDISL